MHSSFLFSVESLSQHLRICLQPGNLFLDNRTLPAEVLPGITVSLSELEPILPVEIDCLDIAEVIADETLKAKFARLCGPELFPFLKKHDFYFAEPTSVVMTAIEVSAWQRIWQDIYYESFCNTSANHPVFRSSTPARENLPSNVIQLFSN